MIRSITRYGLYVSGSNAPVPWFSSVMDIVALLAVSWEDPQGDSLLGAFHD